jgi:hypothetical protein
VFYLVLSLVVVCAHVAVFPWSSLWGGLILAAGFPAYLLTRGHGSGRA